MDWYFLLTLNPLFPFLLPLYLVYRPPRFLIKYIQRRFPDVLFFCETKQRIAALTIDDAPSSYTAGILSVLAQYNAKATFFCIGSQMDDKVDTLRSMVSAGHELGNHAMHDEPSFRLPISQLAEEIDEVDAKIHAVYSSLHVSPPPKYFRPGSGFFNSAMRELVKSLGYRIVLGNVYPHDPQIPKPKLNSWHIASMISEGAIIIVHDRRDYTRETLGLTLKKLQDKGYTLVTVTELLKQTANPDVITSSDVHNLTNLEETPAAASDLDKSLQLGRTSSAWSQL
ncbi:hypothetical protein HGRIS_000725 [Hohenbuehelia grisea]|uniref:chitin deacetylase n=1 Tax=Hohenbuehelia grisea TaxID=104357 RepID=A0ABR3IPJ3_9AGAR